MTSRCWKCNRKLDTKFTDISETDYEGTPYDISETVKIPDVLLCMWCYRWFWEVIHDWLEIE